MVLTIRHIAKQRLHGRPLASDVTPKGNDPAGARRPLADENSQRAALARSVRSQQAEEFAAVDLEVDAVYGGEGTVAQREALKAEDRLRVHSLTSETGAGVNAVPFECRGWQDRRALTRPGSSSLISII